MSRQQTGLDLSAGSNRTFMELKWHTKFFSWAGALCSNRTFMELKWEILKMTYKPIPVLIVPLWNWNCFYLRRYWTPLPVLIVPLWNWNVCIGYSYRRVSRSNRTFMELKSQIRLCLKRRSYRSNRTFMELKCLRWLWMMYQSGSSNRTFMELKFKIFGSIKYSYYVLIVPLWNWNPSLDIRLLCIKSSNRTFMELKWRTKTWIIFWS